jgi:hypothetical protein
MSFEAFLGGFLDGEAAIVKQWGAMDPAYDDNRWDLKTSSVAKKKHLGGVVGYERLRLPPSFANASLAAPNEHAAAQADRFCRRNILRVDDHDVAGLGTVQVFTVSYGDVTHPDDGSRPALRIAVGELDVGIRVLRADSLCTHCFGTGGDGGTGCGFVDEMGAACDHGWLSRGGAKLDLGVPTSSDRRTRPADARWHAWFDG